MESKGRTLTACATWHLVGSVNLLLIVCISLESRLLLRKLLRESNEGRLTLLTPQPILPLDKLLLLDAGCLFCQNKQSQKQAG